MVGMKSIKHKTKKDCPEALLDISRSKFEKAVVKEFIFLEEEVKEVKSNVEWVKKLLFTVLFVIVVNILLKII